VAAADVPQEVNLTVMIGWIVSIDDNHLIIGPFHDELEAHAWLLGIRDNLCQDVEVLGTIEIFYPPSFTEVQGALRAGTGRVGRLHGP
jgi:hypothetical protein